MDEHEIREAGGVDAQAVALAEPGSRLERVLGYVPQALASHAHIIFLAALGVFLVVLPLLGVSVSAKAELIGGNYTNVTSDLGACIAAGGTLHLVRAHRAHRRHVHAELAKIHSELRRLGPAGPDQLAGGNPLSGPM